MDASRQPATNVKASQTSVARTEPPAIFQPLHEQITLAMQHHGVPGVALGILHDGQEHTAGFGATNASYPSPVLPETLFQIGSITKTLTATAILRLVERGELDLDVPVRTYLPDLRLADESVAVRVTLRHLLTHTAGFEGDLALTIKTGRGDDALAQFVARMSEISQQSPLGDLWAYNNAGFYLAGRVIERVTGKPYETAVTELVLAPLGMTHASFFPEEVMLGSFAVGHNVAADSVEVARPWAIPRNANAAGGLVTTTGDLLRYARFSMGDGTAADGARILSRASLDAMQTPAYKADEGRWVGLAWYIRPIDGVPVIGHDGGTIGQIARLRFIPARGFALALLTNANTGSELVDEVTTWALKHYLGLEEPERVHLPRTPEQLAAYAGRYSGTFSTIDMVVRDGGFIAERHDTERVRHLYDTPPPPEPPSPVAFFAEDQIVATEGPLKGATGDFLRGPDGALVWLRIGGRLFRREPRAS
ncbi:MAG TPA: serine hydrolase domain-containing protein [Ktedonobacterales bacterium]